MLYAARTVCGVKQRRPTDSHCASVGGVVPVEINCASLNIGCGSGSDSTPPPRTTPSARASATVTTATIGTQYRLNRSASMSKPPSSCDDAHRATATSASSPGELLGKRRCPRGSVADAGSCLFSMEVRLYAVRSRARSRTEIRHEVAVLRHTSQPTDATRRLLRHVLRRSPRMQRTFCDARITISTDGAAAFP